MPAGTFVQTTCVVGCSYGTAQVGISVAGNGRIDLARPGIDAAGNRLRLIEALLPQPRGDRKRAGTMVAQNQDGRLIVEFRVSAGGDLVHGDKRARLNVSGLMLPGLAHIEQQRRRGGGEQGLQLCDGNL